MQAVDDGPTGVDFCCGLERNGVRSIVAFGSELADLRWCCEPKDVSAFDREKASGAGEFIGQLF